MSSTRLSAFQNPVAFGTARVGEASGTCSVRRNRETSRPGGGVWMYQEERNQLLCLGLVRVPQHDTAKAHLHRA